MLLLQAISVKGIYIYIYIYIGQIYISILNLLFSVAENISILQSCSEAAMTVSIVEIMAVSHLGSVSLFT